MLTEQELSVVVVGLRLVQLHQENEVKYRLAGWKFLLSAPS
jgi:hypothetical protein